MDKKEINRVFLTLNKHLDKMLDMYDSHEWFCIYATGSMNYDLFDDESDVDTKLLLFPNLYQLAGILNMSTTEHDIDGEHCTTCDIRNFLYIAIKKVNPNYLEFFTTDYYIVNPVYEKEFRELRDCGEDILDANLDRFTKSCLGMATSLLKKIEKGDKEGKNLCNLLRLRDFVENYLLYHLKLEYAIKARMPELYMEMKRGTWEMSHDDAVAEAEMAIENIKSAVDQYNIKTYAASFKPIEIWTELMAHHMRRIS